MGTDLVTALPAVPLAAWPCGAFLLDGPQAELARISTAPRGIFPNSWKSYSPATAKRPAAQRPALRWNEVSR